MKVKGGNDRALVVILLLVIFVLLGQFAYLFFTDRLILGNDTQSSGKETPVIDEEQEPVEEKEEEENPADEIEDEKIPLITHTNTTLWPYRLKYPQDWEITKENTECNYDSVSKKELCTSHELEITYTKNPQYAFYLSNCSECGPTPPYCAYSDTSYPKEMLDGYLGEIYYDDYVEIDRGTFRRSFNPRTEDPSGFKYRICVRGENEYGTVYTWGGITAGDVAYKAPDNADEHILKVMDNILLSIERLRD